MVRHPIDNASRGRRARISAIASGPLLSRRRVSLMKHDCCQSGFGPRARPSCRTRAGPIGRREDRREFNARHQPDDGGLRQGSCDQRHVRDPVQRARAGARQPAEKVFAADMLGAHKTTTKELKAMVASGEVKAELPAALDSTHQERDRQAEVAERCRLQLPLQFRSGQWSQGCPYRCSNATPRTATIRRLKDWAGKTLPTIRHHLEMAQDLAAGKTVGSH